MGLQEAELLWEGGCGAEGVYVAYMALSPWGTIWGHTAPARTHAGLAGWVLVAMCPPPGPDSQGQALMVNPRPPHLCGSQGGWHPGVPHTGRWDPLSHACGVPPTV